MVSLMCKYAFPITHFLRKSTNKYLINIRTNCKATPEKKRDIDRMASWQIHSYGKLDELQFSQNVRIPIITKPNDLLIKVHAASVNPMDVAMIGGYGSVALNMMRRFEMEFPLTLGRDFCGSVVSKGLGPSNDIPIGSLVWGVVPVHHQGCHAEYVVLDKTMVAEAPSNLNVCEAASMLYTGVTAYSGLRWFADLNMNDMTGLKALVLGASGGVGSAAVQMLRAASANVSATCSTDAIPFVEDLGAHHILDYTQSDYDEKLIEGGRYDLILDCAGQGTEYAKEKKWDFHTYLTFTTPFLKNWDAYGLVRGTVTSATDLMRPCFDPKLEKRVIRWAYFVPSPQGITHITQLVKNNKMRPTINKIYQFHELPEAYKKMESGHARGKLVIDIAGN